MGRSLLIQHYFDLRLQGLDADVGARIVGKLTETYVLGRCAFLATAAANLVGRERMVSYKHEDGHLLHAVVACTPQAPGEPLRGDGVDILGRESLSGMKAALEATIGPVSIMIGERVGDDEFEAGERETLMRIFATLPWLRQSLLIREEGQHPVGAFTRLGC